MSRSLMFAALFATVPAMAWAQIGTGWTEYMPGRTLQIRGCGSHSGSSTSVETFGLTCADTSGDNRAEDRMQDDYTSGTRQFQGEVRVVSLPGTNVSLKQTFMRDNGAFLMIGVNNAGRLYSVGDNGELATDVIGKWVRINTIHDVGAGTIQIYADGVLKVTKTGARQVAWYNKYGSYRLGSGHGPITVEWRNTRFWRDGKSGGGMMPPAMPDAGVSAPDATAADTNQSSADAKAPDPDPPATGGASGTGGSTGTSTGGSTGTSTGGSKGTGGSEPEPEDEPDAGESGAGGRARSSGCAVGGSGASAFPVLLLLTLFRRRIASRPRAPRSAAGSARG